MKHKKEVKANQTGLIVISVLVVELVLCLIRDIYLTICFLDNNAKKHFLLVLDPIKEFILGRILHEQISLFSLKHPIISPTSCQMVALFVIISPFHIDKLGCLIFQTNILPGLQKIEVNTLNGRLLDWKMETSSYFETLTICLLKNEEATHKQRFR